MKTETLANIISYIESKGPQKPADLISQFSISGQALHAKLRKAVATGALKKIGRPPHTRYGVAPSPRSLPGLEDDLAQVLEENFSYLSPTGSILFGVAAFQAWVNSKALSKDYQSLARAYGNLRMEVYAHMRDRPIDTLPRLQSILTDCQLDSAMISDFYALPQFGKTFLGNLIHAVKTSFNQILFDRIVSQIKGDILACTKQHAIDAILYVPHSIPRKRQFLPELRRRLDLPFPEIVAEKVFSDGIPVAQKSLSKISERIDNASNTIFLTVPRQIYRNVLIIDDAIGSGGTVNEIARKLKAEANVRKCHAYAVVGSYKDLDVISAV
jgi:hypothetical protein